jgi:predicted ester cyclase
MRSTYPVSDDLRANKEMVRRLYLEGLRDGNVDVVGELVAPDVVTHNPMILDAPSGPDSIRGGIEMLRRSFSDIEVDVLELIAEGDRVAVFLRLSGMNTGDYRRGGATNKRGSIRAFFVWRVENGRLAENWGVADRFDLLQQLGVIASDDELAAKMPNPSDSD